MAVTQRTEIDRIEVVGDYKIIQVRTATITEENGVEVSRSYHRHTVSPNADISGESPEVQALVNEHHTDAVVSAFNEHNEYIQSQYGTE